MPTIELTGEVVEITYRQPKTGDKIKSTIIDQTTNPKYQEALSVEWFGKSAPLAADVCEGDTIKVECRIRSRPWNGKWFTEASGFACEVLANRAAPTDSIDELSNPPPADKPGEYGTDDAMPF